MEEMTISVLKADANAVFELCAELGIKCSADYMNYPRHELLIIGDNLKETIDSLNIEWFEVC